MQNESNKGPFPSYFRGSLCESRSSSYARAGWTLAIHLRNEVPFELDDQDFDRLIDAALRKDDPAVGVWELIREHLPRCARAVPSRRRRTFLRGIAEAIEAERV